MKPGAAVVDTSVLVGALLRRDNVHEHALPIVRAADSGQIAPLLLTDFILAETLNFLVRKAGSALARDALDRIESSQGFRIERVTDAVYQAGKNDVFRQYDGLSLVDAMTVAFMRNRRLRRIYSFDGGFDKVQGLERAAAVLA